MDCCWVGSPTTTDEEVIVRSIIGRLDEPTSQEARSRGVSGQSRLQSQIANLRRKFQSQSRVVQAREMQDASASTTRVRKPRHHVTRLRSYPLLIQSCLSHPRETLMITLGPYGIQMYDEILLSNVLSPLGSGCKFHSCICMQEGHRIK